MIAVYHDHSHIVEVLIRFKSDVNLQTKVGVVIYVVYIVHVFAVRCYCLSGLILCGCLLYEINKRGCSNQLVLPTRPILLYQK